MGVGNYIVRVRSRAYSSTRQVKSKGRQGSQRVFTLGSDVDEPSFIARTQTAEVPRPGED
jgi:hypothetical protein